MGREALQELWQKYKVDLAFYGHVHSYERTCPVYQVCAFRFHLQPDQPLPVV
jgi:predicted phosphohydrolase